MNGDLKQTFVDFVNELLRSEIVDARVEVAAVVDALIEDGWRIPRKTNKSVTIEIYDIEWSDRKC